MKLIPVLFKREDIISEFKSEKQYSNWVYNKLKSHKIIKIRNDLYALVDVSVDDVYVNKFEMGSKVSDTSYIGYHSALEYYGLAQKEENSVIVCSESKFNDFKFNDVDYLFHQIACLDQIEVLKRVRVTSIERTIVDCINNVNLAGGISELLYALNKLEALDENKVMEILKVYDKKILYQKTGYLLESFRDKFNISESFFNFCEDQISNKINYFLESEYRDIAFNKKWNLYCPTSLEEAGT